MILSEKPDTNLETIFELRRKENENFNSQEILSIIKRISQALKNFEEYN